MCKRVLVDADAIAGSGAARFAPAPGLVLLMACLFCLTGCGGSMTNEFELMQKEPKTGAGLALPSGAGAESGTVRLPRSVEPLASVATPGSPAYKIGPQDVLDISVYKVPELARTVLVDNTGTIDVPLLGGVVAAGKTARVLEKELASKLGAKYLQSPQVTVNIKEYNSQRVTIEGAVKTPGVHALKGNTSLQQLIAMSGGLDRDTTDWTVVVFRQTDGKRYAAKFDVDAIRKGEAADPAIMPGDVVIANSSAIKSVWGDFLKAVPIATFAKVLI